MLNKVKPYVPSNTMNMIYNSLLAPYFDYCDVIWGTCNSTTRHKVQKMQNRAAKIITGGSWYDSSTVALNALQWYNKKTISFSHNHVQDHEWTYSQLFMQSF